MSGYTTIAEMRSIRTRGTREWKCLHVRLGSGTPIMFNRHYALLYQIYADFGNKVLLLLAAGGKGEGAVDRSADLNLIE